MVEPRERMLTESELEGLLAAAWDSATAALPLVLFLADTGCRIGEAVALRWADVDLGRGLARIERSIDHLGRLGPTKTRRGRVVELSTRLAASLAERRPDVFGEASLVFPNAEGKPLDSRNFAQRDFRRIACVALGT
ncbi:MAG TPA: tyrosine-type recombinase/integrase [Burkholderiales bacterium]|nr:tyrosine-type recombinase/integrase [Burkholderiales bacterium]